MQPEKCDIMVRRRVQVGGCEAGAQVWEGGGERDREEKEANITYTNKSTQKFVRLKIKFAQKVKNRRGFFDQYKASQFGEKNSIAHGV